MRIYTVWAALKDEPDVHWMIWACDEYSYDGDYDAREAELKAAKERQAGDVEFREVTLNIDDLALTRAFAPIEVDAIPEATES